MLNKPLTILIVEDNPGDYLLVSEYLKEVLTKPSIQHATSLAEAIKTVEKSPPDVILLDLSLPDGMGLSTFQILHAKAEQIPTIILTGVEDTALALESLQIGAQDYIVKDDCTPTLLAKSIQYGIERSKILRRLQQSEEQYKYLFKHNPLPMLAFDSENEKVLMVNGAAQAFYGYSETRFLKMYIDDLRVKNQLPTADQKKEDQDLQHQKLDGAVVDVELHYHNIVIEGKKAVLTVVHDVTDRNHAKERVRQSEQNFRTISENFPNGAVTVLDRRLNILYMAGKEFHIKGVDAHYFENTRITDHFDSPNKEIIAENMQKVFGGGNMVVELKHDAQSYILSAVPLYESNGQIEKILCASQNITEQKKNEAEKELLIEELTRNNSDLQQFSYITSHNLRSPLSNLLGIINLIDMTTVTDPNTAVLLKNFEACTLQLNETVNDLINVLIIKNSVNTKKEILDIRKVFEKVIHSLQTNLSEKRATVTVNMDAAWEVAFNRSYLESILLNLLTNAIKYSSPNRDPMINVWTEPTADGMKLYFADNGLGIDLRRHRNKIFGLYQRFHDHPDSKGLGLYIVNSQISVMGGEINVESEVDKGTTFIITFKKQ